MVEMNEWKSLSEWFDAVKTAQTGGAVDKRLEPSEQVGDLSPMQVMLMEHFAMDIEQQNTNIESRDK